MRIGYRPSRRNASVVGAVAALSIAASGVYGLASAHDRSSTFALAVDPHLTSAPAVEGFAAGDSPRAVGRIADESGESAVVLDEVVVSTRDDASLQSFLRRHSGKVVDSFPAEPGEPRTSLVRMTGLPEANAGGVARKLKAIEPHSGTLRVDGDRTLSLLGAVADETGQDGIVEVSPNWVDDDSDSVADGELYEAGSKNVFEWSYVSSTAPQAIGLDAAWQLLDAHGKLTPKVNAMVSDGGFVKSADLPEYTLREDKWGARGRTGCENSGCPFHGTHVALTIAATQGNHKGTAGVAGAVVRELVAVAKYKDRYKTLRKLQKHADTYRPDVINMSYGGLIHAFKKSTAGILDRRYKHITEHGALLVASAGNRGDNVDSKESVTVDGFPTDSPLKYPCESSYVLCVGGLSPNTTDRHPNSNFGDRNDARSVELYAPWQVQSVADAGDPKSTAKGSFAGTSAASPFVSGVALLVKRANPSLTPAQVRAILLDTAHRGVGNIPGDSAWAASQMRRVDAAAAVAAALGVSLKAPEITITKPANDAGVTPGDPVLLAATAVNFAGVQIPVSWKSDRDGALFGGKGQLTQQGVVLSQGVHHLTASATDVRGRTSSDSVTVRVEAKQAIVHIVSPGDGMSQPAGAPLVLKGASQRQDSVYESLQEDQVRWTVRRAGTSTPIFSRTGHNQTVQASLMTPGAYTVQFTGKPVGGPKATTSVTVIVTATAAGQQPPVAAIAIPGFGVEYVAFPGKDGAEVRLRGSAHDAQDGSVPGTALQWVARSGNQRVVLCAGSTFPKEDGTGVGGFGTYQDCSDTTVRLKPPASSPASNTWAIELRAVDSSGAISAPAIRTIEVAPAMVG